MKRTAILMFCLLMMAGAALADTMEQQVQLTDAKALVVQRIDSVADIKVDENGDLTTLTYTMQDETMPRYLLLVSYSEVLTQRDILDLSQDEIEALVAYTTFDAEEYAYEVIDMEDGWPAVLIDYEGVSDWVDAFTVIDGYIIQVHGFHEDFAPLTDAENAMAFTLLDGVDIIQSEGEATRAGIPNPMHEATADAFAEAAGFAPAFADGVDAMYFTYDGSELVQAQFTQDGIHYTLRAAPGTSEVDISGVYGTFATEETAEVGGNAAQIRLDEGEGGVCQWYDAAAQINYSLSCGEGATVQGLVRMAQALVG